MLLAAFVVVVGLAAVFGPDTRDTGYSLFGGKEFGGTVFGGAGFGSAGRIQRRAVQEMPQEGNGVWRLTRKVSSGCAEAEAVLDAGMTGSARMAVVPLIPQQIHSSGN
ncbi:hypothetical protein [Frankia sp. R82]|uniref:hypothetical protein n=1 Tax=Frankia sp. R82 TaxID=2950553 RepID=UPI002043E114|nr:hypothetical protein [Frankia sp. R82]MCM3883793.1 hypothetical protein [Frankia sp. R82]